MLRKFYFLVLTVFIYATAPFWWPKQVPLLGAMLMAAIVWHSVRWIVTPRVKGRRFKTGAIRPTTHMTTIELAQYRPDLVRPIYQDVWHKWF